MTVAEFSLKFSGELAERHLIGAYDAAVALSGFERSLALTAHAVINGNIIVKAPALKGAEVLFAAPEEGSWKAKALVVVGGLWALNNVEPHSPIGHLMYSAYDYVLNSATGVDLDYDRPIRTLIEEQRNAAPEASKNLSVDVLDGVVERVEKSIEDMHRPIVESETAAAGQVLFRGRRDGVLLDRSTYEYVSRSIERPKPEQHVGAVSSYNMNSFTGRLFIPAMSRTVPFVLSESIRDRNHIDKITASLRANALRVGNELFEFQAIVMETPSGRVRRMVIFDF